MNKWTNLITFSLYSLTCMLNPLSAEVLQQEVPATEETLPLTEKEVIEEGENFVKAGSKQLADEEHLKLKKERLENDKDENDDEIITNAAYLTTHPMASHGIAKMSANLDRAELNDGSVWDIYYSSDRSTVRRFMSTNDQIIISPTSSIFAPTDYKLVSQRTGESIYVSLALLAVNPIDATFGLQRLWINRVDYLYDVYYGGNFYQLTLSDGSIWNVDKQDNYYCSFIYPGDVVIIGVDERWGASTRNILIHFDSLEYVRSDCIAY